MKCRICGWRMRPIQARVKLKVGGVRISLEEVRAYRCAVCKNVDVRVVTEVIPHGK